MRVALPLAAAAVLLAGCGRGPDDPRRLSRDEVLVQVSASGTADNRPDQARIDVGVSSIDRDARAVSARNGAKMNAVIAALKRLGVADADVQTRALTVQRIDYGPNRGRFEASNTVNVRLRDVEKAGEAVAAVTAAGANVLSGPDFRQADPEAASRRAYVSAFRSARARAEAYAAAAGMRVARVLTIRDTGAGGGEMVAYEADMARAPQAAAPPPVMAGTSTSSATVTIDAVLGPKVLGPK